MNNKSDQQKNQLSSSAQLHSQEHFYEHASTFNKIKAVFPKAEKPLQILDVGCGDGRLAQTLIKQGHTITGLDINETALQKAAARGIKTVKTDLENSWSLSSDQYDVVLVLDTLEHVVNQDNMIAESWRVLKNGGWLIVAYPNHFDIRNRFRMLGGGGIVHWSHTQHENATARNYSHLRFLRHEELLELLKKYKFGIEQEQFNFMGGGIIPRRLLPSCIRKGLLKKYPNLLSGKFIVRARKLDSENVRRQKTILLDKTVLGI